mmetsp:Transcript_13192/g.41808  ORF Transcript_13192/g.41808 Transcript_13192/m.41808 type:complete len:230 (+) Transcript_13192:353-1042(+)
MAPAQRRRHHPRSRPAAAPLLRRRSRRQTRRRPPRPRHRYRCGCGCAVARRPAPTSSSHRPPPSPRRRRPRRRRCRLRRVRPVCPACSPLPGRASGPSRLCTSGRPRRTRRRARRRPQCPRHARRQTQPTGRDSGPSSSLSPRGGGGRGSLGRGRGGGECARLCAPERDEGGAPDFFCCVQLPGLTPEAESPKRSRRQVSRNSTPVSESSSTAALSLCESNCCIATFFL